MITEVPGVRVGHWTDRAARTGCTVVLLPAGTVASGEVRGGAPGTREWELLDPRRTVDRVNAIVLSGGSAFGLAACDGVVRWCEERGIGWPTAAGPVPIVVGMALYDLAVGSSSVRPGPEQGYTACVAAQGSPDAVGAGAVGAGAGATMAKWRGPEHRTAGGLGSAACERNGLVVAALAAVNALGERWSPGDPPRVREESVRSDVAGATTLVVVATNGRLDKVGCRSAAEAGHDGLARALDPVHTGADGDAVVVAATGAVTTTVDTVRSLTAWTVHKAVSSAGPVTGGP